MVFKVFSYTTFEIALYNSSVLFKKSCAHEIALAAPIHFQSAFDYNPFAKREKGDQIGERREADQNNHGGMNLDV